ncbi:MAG: endonuclease [Candidatus Izemoplasmatales bacterium]
MIKKLQILMVFIFSMMAFISCSDLITTEEPQTSNEETSEVITEDPTTEVTTEEPTNVIPTEAPTTEEPTTEVPTEEPTTDVPTEEPTTDVPTEEPTTDVPTEEPTTEVPTTEIPTEEPTTEVPTEEPTTEEPTTEDSYYDAYVDLIDVHSMNDGTMLEVSGVVYFMTQNGYYIQDDTYNLFIFTNTTPEVELGDRVVIDGELTTYRQVKQIGDNHTLVEINAYEQDIQQEVNDYVHGSTSLEPGHLYTLTGEVRIEGSYNTTFLYSGNTKIAEIYYKSLSHSISAIEAYEGEIITLDLLYYAEGDDVPRYAFQGSESHIQVYIPDDSLALQADADLLDSEKTLFNDFDFGIGYYGSTYTIISVSGDVANFVSFNGSIIYVTKPSETEGDQLGSIMISVSLNDEEPILKTINIIVKAEGSSTIDMAYYESVIGLSGDDLLYELNSILNEGFKQLSYDDAKWVLEESDRDPNNPNNVILVYTRESVQGQWNYPNWNREHTWPQSKLHTSGQKADMHNLKPSDVAENSRRGNLPFGYMTGSGVYEPHDDVKGDVARILFYMATMYLDLDIESGILGQMSILLDWHQMDPVDDFERNRNEVIYSYQKNRNPFIDYPHLVEEIWG